MEGLPEELPEPDPDLATPAADPADVRGVWVTRWTYDSPEDVDQILDDCAAAGVTDVFLQVRGRFDAFYESELEPWARELSGALGGNPGWDPLAYAVQGAHERGLKLHAWINMYALWQGGLPPRSVGVPHPLEVHPDWRIADRSGRTTDQRLSYQFASPGNPEVRDHLVAVVDDLDERYDVDGIHLDYLRYPGRDWGYDPASVAAARAEGADDFDGWRRRQILDTVAELHEVVDVPLTGAVWGIHTDRWGWGASGGSDSYFQDSHAMLQAGTLAAAAPMIYWPVQPERGARLDFATLAADHVAHAGRGRVWAGIDASKLSWEQIEACILAAREVGAHGVVIFEYKALRDNGWFDDLAALW